MNNTVSEHAFWTFSCDLYQQGCAQHTLLNLQNEQKKNINLCLLLFYLEHLNLQLTEYEVTQLAAKCHDMDEQLLTPHRHIRQQLKLQFIKHPRYSESRQQLLNSELQLERLQQSELVQLVNKFTLSSKKPSNNLSFYLSDIQIKQLRASLTDKKS
ncbi:hypothetical protein PSECIP111951_03373 [Pseudoalteromonas holothuriae]|uniref:TIGR02444 family protein n=1 Tax=Pseudoalteromonas holothuriae TaxID=2963714 RepID=A0ABN8UPV3_9GAMM|nr:TIGR02444 family protein [Pseudoalteromonas sp. CIP111951]CAH9065490.1 hypothetical protein PSECIP111951_03373 [Pseudoalteromonas sp. CIP111951]